MMKTPLFTPSHVANFILTQAEYEEAPVTQLKLLKLVYLLYGWVRAILDERLFDEDIQAWKLGPVVPSLYHEFKRFGSDPITERSFCMDDYGTVTRPSIPDDHPVVIIMKRAWDVYKPFKALALVNKTHEPDSPWERHYQPELTDKIIPDIEIKDYFTKKIRSYINATLQ